MRRSASDWRRRSAPAPRALEPRLREQDRELLAAEPGSDVDVATVRAEQVGERQENLVAGVMPEPVVDQLEVVQIGEHDRELPAEPLPPGDLRVERIEKAPTVDEARQLVGDRLPLDDVVEPRVLERDRSLGGEPLGEFRRLLAEAALGRMEHELHRRRLVSRRQVELDARRPVEVADPADLLPVLQQPAAAGPRRFRDHVQDHGHQRARVVGRRERVADERERLARLPPAGDRGTSPLAVRRPEPELVSRAGLRTSETSRTTVTTVASTARRASGQSTCDADDRGPAQSKVSRRVSIQPDESSPLPDARESPEGW